MVALKKRVIASTLVEVICAILVITVVFTISLMIFQNTTKSSNQALIQKAWILAGNELQDLQLSQIGKVIRKTEANLILVKHALPNRDWRNLIHQTVSVYKPSGELILVRQNLTAVNYENRILFGN